MPCYKPLNAWQEHDGQQPCFKAPTRWKHRLQIPCNQCIGCRLRRSADWATRIIHEASLWDRNSFITLTYDDENIPWDGSLNKTHFQKFMKRLRFANSHKTIRFFHVGEYGDKLQRPHYHALLFNHDWDDKELWASRDGIHTYRSDSLAKLWPYGFSTTGDLTWETAAYCSRYCVKKITGKKSQEHYERVNQFTGEIINLQPEYATMSLKPAIGREWFNEYQGDCFPKDYVTHDGKKRTIPPYYDKLLERVDPELFAEIKEKRIRAARDHFEDQSAARLAAKEQVTKAKVKTLTRRIEQ